MADSGTQTDFEPETSHAAPVIITTEPKETTKPIVSKASMRTLAVYKGAKLGTAQSLLQAVC